MRYHHASWAGTFAQGQSIDTLFFTWVIEFGGDQVELAFNPCLTACRGQRGVRKIATRVERRGLRAVAGASTLFGERDELLDHSAVVMARLW